jgi:omega-amidase
MKLTLALAQLNIQLGNVDHNCRRGYEMITQAAEQGCQLVLLPELWTTGYDLSQSAHHAQANQACLVQLTELANRFNIAIGGSLIESSQGKYYNSFCLVTPGNVAPACYRKIHLFGLMHEQDWLQSGDRSVLAAVSGIPAGLAICYDLRFPELFRQYALDGAQIVLLPAEWPLRRRAHWEILLQARAIENQFFVIGVNAVGASGGETFGGTSLAISPWGETLAQASPGEEACLIVEIDTRQIDQVRSRIPVFQDRRADVYGSPGAAYNRDCPSE